MVASTERTTDPAKLRDILAKIDLSRTRKVGAQYSRQIIQRLDKAAFRIISGIRRGVIAETITRAQVTEREVDSLILDAGKGITAQAGLLPAGAFAGGQAADDAAQWIFRELGQAFLDGAVDFEGVYFNQAIDASYRFGVDFAAFTSGQSEQARRLLQRLPSKATASRGLAREQMRLLAGFSRDVSNDIRDLLAKGIGEGRSASQLAVDVRKRLRVSAQRANTIARTEVTRASALGSIDAYGDLGIAEVQALVEFTLNVHGDAEPCPICIDLQGKTFRLEEARGIIPVHPNCQCGWLPHTKDNPIDAALDDLRKRVEQEAIAAGVPKRKINIPLFVDRDPTEFLASRRGKR